MAQNIIFQNFNKKNQKCLLIPLKTVLSPVIFKDSPNITIWQSFGEFWGFWKNLGQKNSIFGVFRWKYTILLYFHVILCVEKQEKFAPDPLK